MGILDYISSTSNSIKRNAWSSYDYSRAAVTKIHNVFTDRTVIEKLCHYLPDEDTRSKIAKNSAAVAVQEGLKFVPGGSTVYNIFRRSLSYDKKSKGHREDLQKLKDKVGRMEKELGDYKKLSEQTAMWKPISEDLQELKHKVGRMEKELGDHKNLFEQTEMRKPISELDCMNTHTLGLNQKPEDVIRVFMMKEFVGQHLLDDLIVPGVRSRKPSSKYDQ